MTTLTNTQPLLSEAAPISASRTRYQSIDILRGIVMVLMALDHIRDYFHADAYLFDPLDPAQTTPVLFATRWITHFCAPVFVLLAGTSAYLVGQRKGRAYLSSFLLTRGLWLILLEVTLIDFAWFFNIHFTLITLVVIWAIGIGMVALSLAIRLGYRFVMLTGLVLIFGHNLLDGVHVSGDGLGAILWSMMHEQRIFDIGSFQVFVGYPVLPWIGVIFIGYALGRVYLWDAVARKKHLMQTGLIFISLFVILRALNIYGDSHLWTAQPTFAQQVMSFMNVSKYPPSLLYILATLGPSLVGLAFAERWKGKMADAISVLGRVPMFYYLLHLFLIHTLAVGAALLTGYQLSDMVFNTWVTDSPNLKGYGFPLWVTYGVWAGVVAILYPLCRWYDRYKANHREKRWLSYL